MLHAYFKVEQEGFVPEAAKGDVVTFSLELGNQWVNHGILSHCDKTGNAIEPGTQIGFKVQQESSGAVVKSATEQMAEPVPNGDIAANSGEDVTSKGDIRVAAKK